MANDNPGASVVNVSDGLTCSSEFDPALDEGYDGVIAGLALVQAKEEAGASRLEPCAGLGDRSQAASARPTQPNPL